MTISFLSS